jgi:tetratricopeptide (TPR) repeat protein
MGHLAAWVFLGENAENHRLAALTAARRAVALDPENADARANLGYALLFDRRHDEGGTELDLALRANANHADAWMFSGDLRVMRGFPVDGIDLMRKALRLNPYPPGWYYWLLGYAQYAAGHYRDAVATLRHEATYRTVSKRILAAALAQRGRQDEAEREAREFMSLVPTFSAGAWAATQPFLQQPDLQTFVDGYVKAGLPE